jgi:hypothetical protein
MNEYDAKWAVNCHYEEWIVGKLNRFFGFMPTRYAYKRDPISPKERNDMGVLHYTYENMESGAVEILFLVAKQEDGKWFVTWIDDMEGRGYLHLTEVKIEGEQLVIVYSKDGKLQERKESVDYLLKQKQRGTSFW